MADKYADREKDIFGLPKLDSDAELGISFTLMILGVLVLYSTFYTAGLGSNPAVLLGFMLVATGYLFVLESVRELEQKDHFLSRKLMTGREDNSAESEDEEG
ncbi:MAG: hypothetical protein ACI83Q_000774 [Colwellia polaris]|jgi:hypothetical protein